MNKRPSHCRGCKKKLRPSKRSVADYPGTVAHQGRGYCTTCGAGLRHQRREHEKQQQPLDPEILERMSRIDPSTRNWIERRRKNWIPASGWRTQKGLTHG